jgi:outer membrane protein TolC
MAAQQRLQRLELQMRLEIETAIAEISSASQRLQATGTAILQARESWRIEQQKYELGKGTIVDVLDAQAALLESQTTHYRVQALLRIAAAQLQLATGER